MKSPTALQTSRKFLLTTIATYQDALASLHRLAPNQLVRLLDDSRFTLVELDQRDLLGWPESLEGLAMETRRLIERFEVMARPRLPRRPNANLERCA